jgi:hypothetical protein
MLSTLKRGMTLAVLAGALTAAAPTAGANAATIPSVSNLAPKLCFTQFPGFVDFGPLGAMGPLGPHGPLGAGAKLPDCPTLADLGPSGPLGPGGPLQALGR